MSPFGVIPADAEGRVPDGMRAFRPLAVVAIGCAVVLGLVQMTGAAEIMHRLLGLAVVVMAAIMSGLMWRTRHRWWAVALALVAVVFLPIWSDVAFWLWWIVDGISVLVLATAALRFRGPDPEPDPDDLPDRFL
jgi:CBS-domain-containing membrane protein